MYFRPGTLPGNPLAQPYSIHVLYIPLIYAPLVEISEASIAIAKAKTPSNMQ